MEEEEIDAIVMCLELVDAGAGLETEDKDFVVACSKGKRVLTRQLAGHHDAGPRNQNRFFANALVTLKVYLVHAHKAI